MWYRVALETLHNSKIITYGKDYISQISGTNGIQLEHCFESIVGNVQELNRGRNCSEVIPIVVSTLAPSSCKFDCYHIRRVVNLSQDGLDPPHWPSVHNGIVKRSIAAVIIVSITFQNVAHIPCNLSKQKI